MPLLPIAMSVWVPGSSSNGLKDTDRAVKEGHSILNVSPHGERGPEYLMITYHVSVPKY